ncbi:uncharacterized protein LACBIDRAFT_322418 [Laccaria bicolor S238N-H82]|uniref:Predicted protein n=1 Tax=Laccaria bicolor (strain S238N-H82 / ATCC MYA-4686) TaxID=486041 RepID=B0CW80_LACBS|nr:uncharacterized protein LACBIDRAFT_322418 [Laccaria bicolor S238N-H82]EDR13460.1 predicted protein [Laccaria bicolor S238N-H82]|eukprot:XP_001875958.1 predicted protein [Laccaria bicolor S238N-H82]
MQEEEEEEGRCLFCLLYTWYLDACMMYFIKRVVSRTVEMELDLVLKFHLVASRELIHTYVHIYNQAHLVLLNFMGLMSLPKQVTSHAAIILPPSPSSCVLFKIQCNWQHFRVSATYIQFMNHSPGRDEEAFFQAFTNQAINSIHHFLIDIYCFLHINIFTLHHVLLF